MRFDSPIALALVGALSVHLVIITIGDALIVTHPFVPEPPAPHVELVDIQMPEPEPPKPPPPEIKPEPEPEPEPEPVKTTPLKVPTTQPERVQPKQAPDPLPPAPPSDTPPDPTAPGGEQVVKMDDIAPDARGNVPVQKGKLAGDRIGRGGAGGGTGSGTGSGNGGDAPLPPPVSVATIKTPAKPKGDFGYFDAGKEYPAEARQLGIEGVIKVKLTVDDTGKVRSSVLLTKLGHGLDELALKQAAKLAFTPARDTDDHPVASVVVWTFNMTLPK